MSPRPRSRTHLTGRTAILAVVVCAIVLSLAYPVQEYLAQQQRIAELRAQNAEMSERIERLRERKRKLNDPEYIRRLARTRLHYVLPGGTNYIVVDEQDDATPGREARPERASERPWFVNLWKSVEAADRKETR